MNFNLEILNLVRVLMDAKIKVSYINILDNYDMKTTLKVDYYKLGIILDLDCKKSEDIFNQV